MGRMFHATCRACQHAFNASDGGGFSNQLLRCSACAEDKSIDHEELGDTHWAMVKGFCGRAPLADPGEWHHFAGKPITLGKYKRAVEKHAGACACGGRFAYGMPARCPLCLSDQVTDDGTFMQYD